MLATILHVTDAHLSPRNTLFRDNVARIQALVAADRPDLTVATGDLSLDGADRDEDLALAASIHAGFPGPVFALPGNHDTGSHPHTMARQPFDSTRLDRFRRHFGPGRFLHDLPGWRVIGLNSEVMGTAHPEEAAQAAFIAEAAAGIGDRRVALFLHKPVFVTEPQDPHFDYWSVPPHARGALGPILAHPNLRLIASGHLHLHHEFSRGPVRYVWAPPLSFVVHPADQPGMPGQRHTGALLHRLHENHAETVLLAPPGMEAPLHTDIQHLTYPPQPAEA
jgi:alkaline phosphatase D